MDPVLARTQPTPAALAASLNRSGRARVPDTPPTGRPVSRLRIVDGLPDTAEASTLASTDGGILSVVDRPDPSTSCTPSVLIFRSFSRASRMATVAPSKLPGPPRP